jgi:alkyl hydroperoxide reductase subunit F
VEREAKKIDGKEAFDMLMVGGGPAAVAAAIAARRHSPLASSVKTLAARRWIRWPLKLYFSQGNRSVPIWLAIEQQVRAYDVDIMNLQRAKKAGAEHRSEE